MYFQPQSGKLLNKNKCATIKARHKAKELARGTAGEYRCLKRFRRSLVLCRNKPFAPKAFLIQGLRVKPLKITTKYRLYQSRRNNDLHDIATLSGRAYNPGIALPKRYYNLTGKQSASPPLGGSEPICFDEAPDPPQRAASRCLAE
jgi:hypothetical protein